MWPEDRDRIESAIDAVARGMTAGAPRAGFRTRVLAHIGERRSTWQSPWIIAPAALAVATILAVALFHEHPEHPAASSPVARSERGPAANSHVPPGGTTANAESGHPAPPLSIATSSGTPQRAVRDRHGTPATETGGSSTGAAIASDVDELAPPAIDVEAIAVDPLPRPEPLTVQQLEVPPIARAPIGDGDRQ